MRPGWPRAAGMVWASHFQPWQPQILPKVKRSGGALRWMLGALKRNGLIVQKLFWLLQEDGGGEKGFDMIDI